MKDSTIRRLYLAKRATENPWFVLLSVICNAVCLGLGLATWHTPIAFLLYAIGAIMLVLDVKYLLALRRR